jgi:hypothetical protein
MNSIHESPQEGKMSRQFSARLSRLKPDAKLHAIVLLGGDASGASEQTRQTNRQRRAAIANIHESATEALKEIDQILRRFGGRRLSDQPTALGSVPVESNPAGIAALANSTHVRAILEDQQISHVL